MMNGAVAVRDSKDPNGPTLALTAAVWAEFTARTKHISELHDRADVPGDELLLAVVHRLALGFLAGGDGQDRDVVPKQDPRTADVQGSVGGHIGGGDGHVVGGLEADASRNGDGGPASGHVPPCE